MSHTPVHENMNIAETEQAIRDNSAKLQQAVIEENVVRSEIQTQEGQQKQSESSGVEGAVKSGVETTSGNKALSTEGGLATDIALEASGIGGVAKLAKDGIEIIRDMDPGKFGNAQTMENFATPKAGRSIQGLFVSDIVWRSNLASQSVNGEDKINGAQADLKTLESLKSTQELKMSANLEAQKHLGNAHAHKATLGGQAYDARMAPGGSMGGGRAPQLALNEMKPKGPTQDMLEETGQA